MQAHPNISILEKIYGDFQRGDLASALAACADNITFQIAGKSPLAGKYTKADLAGRLAGRLQEGRSLYQLEVHDTLASDRHGVVLASERIGASAALRVVHVWRFENGQPVAWYSYPRDLYQMDAAWAGVDV